MRTFKAGEEIGAHGRKWIVVCPPMDGVDCLLADPVLSEEEKQAAARAESLFERLVEKGSRRLVAPPRGTYMRTMIMTAEVEED